MQVRGGRIPHTHSGAIDPELLRRSACSVQVCCTILDGECSVVGALNVAASVALVATDKKAALGGGDACVLNWTTGANGDQTELGIRGWCFWLGSWAGSRKGSGDAGEESDVPDHLHVCCRKREYVAMMSEKVLVVNLLEVFVVVVSLRCEMLEAEGVVMTRRKGWRVYLLLNICIVDIATTAPSSAVMMAIRNSSYYPSKSEEIQNGNRNSLYGQSVPVRSLGRLSPSPWPGAISNLRMSWSCTMLL